MRRTTTILTVCLCVVGGCRGGAAQEPYDGVLAAAKRPATSARAPVAQTPEPEVVATEVDVPWAIALLSDGKLPAIKKAAKVIGVDNGPDSPETIAAEADLHVAIDPEPAYEKPATPKTCSGVVNRRS
jgi:glucose/arabinose dehydrogenase